MDLISANSVWEVRYGETMETCSAFTNIHELGKGKDAYLLE